MISIVPSSEEVHIKINFDSCPEKEVRRLGLLSLFCKNCKAIQRVQLRYVTDASKALLALTSSITPYIISSRLYLIWDCWQTDGPLPARRRVTYGSTHSTTILHIS